MAWPPGPAATASWTSSGSGRPAGDEQLEPDQVEAGDRLGHRVLDLQPGVHLEEVGVAVPIDDELDGSGIDVADGPGGGDGRFDQAGPQGRGDDGRRCLLDDLLVAALDAALPLEQRHRVAVGVGQHLHLDVPGVPQVALEEHRCRRRRPPRPRAGRRPRPGGG